MQIHHPPRRIQYDSAFSALIMKMKISKPIDLTLNHTIENGD
jgi:hypothetical protein